MRRVMLLAVSVLTIVTMALSPAFAHDWDGDGWDEEFGFWVVVPVFISSDDICDWYDCDWDDRDDCDWDDRDDCDWDDHDRSWNGHDWGWNDHDWEGPVHLID